MIRIALAILLVITLSAVEAVASYIGLQMQDYSSREEPYTGVKVTGIKKGSPADRSGIETEDILVEANGVTLTSARTLADLVRSLKPGDPLKVRGWRRGGYVTLTVVSVELPPSLIHVERGKQAYNTRELDSAIDEYTKALTFDPDNVEASLGRARAYFEKKEYGKTIDDMSKVLTSTPNVEALVIRGICHARRKEYDLAIADYTEALRINSRIIEAYTNRASLYLSKHDLTAALADVRYALDIDPNNAFALELRARISELKGKKDDARVDRERSAKSRLDVGLAESKKGNFEKAIMHYSAAIALNTRYNAPILYNRGISYEKQGDYANAVKDYTDAVKLNPRFAEAFLRRGVVSAERLGDYLGAERDWNTVIKVEPKGSVAQKARENLKKLHEMKNSGRQ